jgi:hypothetical protein
MPISITSLGKVQLYKGTTLVSSHTAVEEAIEKAVNLGNGDYRIKYPERTLKAYGILASATPGDTTPPSQVTWDAIDPGHVVSAVSIYVKWRALSVTDNVAVAGFQIWRDGQALTNVPYPTMEFTDTGLTASTLYTYKIAAYDAAGNVGAFSTDQSFITAANASPVWNIAQQELTTFAYYPLNLATVCTDADGTSLTFSTVSGTFPPGITPNYASRQIAGTPTTVGVYTVTVRATDGIVNVDQLITFNVLDADSTAPNVPAGLAESSKTKAQIVMTWTRAVDPTVAGDRTSGLAGYKVYRDGAFRETIGDVTTYTDIGLSAGVTYNYSLDAFDAAGNYSGQCTAVPITTQVANTPPAFGPDYDNAIMTLQLASVTEGQAFTRTIDARDLDSDVMTFTVTANPNSLTFTGGTQVLDTKPATITGTAGAAGSTLSITVSVDDGQAVGALNTSLSLTGGGSGKAWTFGHAFKQGDVKATEYITATGPTQFQAEVRNRWSDGSVKYAVLSGIGGTAVALSATGTTPATGEVALTDPQASVTFTGGVTGTYACPTTNTVGAWNKAAATLVRKIAGPVMTERHYYVPTTDAHVAVWFYVRSYVGAATEVETVIENGWFNVATPTAKTYTAVVSVGGSTRYTATNLTHYHHSRWSRVDWVGTDPVITPVHSGAYLRSTKLVPNYGFASPTAAAWSANGQVDTWGAPVNSENPAPFAQANFPSSMGDYGYDETIGLLPRLDALYVTSQNVVAYRSMVGNARSWGRYSVHYRDETTGRPFKVSAPAGNAGYATTIGFADGGTTKYGTEAGTVNLPVTSGSYVTITPTHCPAPAYLAYLITGRWQFMENCQFLATFNWLCVPSTRQGASGVFVPSGGAMTTRGAAWSWRTLGMAACITPDASTGLDGGLKTEFVGMCTGNASYYRTTYVGGSSDNGIGGVAQYGAAADARPWMQDFLVATVGFVSDLGVMSSGNQAIHDQFRDWQYKWIVGRFGATTATYCWQDAAQYAFLLEPPGQSHIPANYYDVWGDLYLANNLGATCSLSGDAHTGYGVWDMVTSYWANLTPGLAYAVQHSASGASAAFGLLSNCASYQSVAVNSGVYGGFHNNPMWGVVPR